MGWDAFGLPAENDALLKGLHPKETVPRYAANFKRQLKLSGCAYDWTREINSSSPEYYRWTQWFFLLLTSAAWPTARSARNGGATNAAPSWPTSRWSTAAAGATPTIAVTKKDLEQWYFKITAYADRLLEDLDGIDWPEPIKLMQRNWIGRSRRRGTRLSGRRPSGQGSALLHHPARHCLRRLVHGAGARASAGRRNHHAGAARRGRGIRHAGAPPERYRAALDRQGKDRRLHRRYAHNLFSDKDIPIWIADYVLMGYGTGAIMAAPGEDQRDFEFATQVRP